MVASEQVRIEIRAEILKAMKNLRKVRKEVNNLQRPNIRSFKRVAAAQEQVVQGQQKLADAMKSQKQRMLEAQPAFAGYALSLLFFGQQLQRTFTQIGRFGVNTFKEISATVEGTTNNATMLEGAFKFLGFTIGEALDPLLGLLIPIVIKIGEWINDNPKLTAGIITLGAALGAIIATGGGLKLAYDGFVGLNGTIKAITTSADGVSSYDWKGLGSKIQKGIGVVAILYAVEQAADAFQELEEGKFGNAMVSALSSGLLGIGGLKLLKGGKGGGVLIAVGVALDLINQGKFIQTINSVLGLIFSLIETSIQNIGEVFKTGFVNSIKTAISELLDNSVIGAALGLAGYDLGAGVNKLLKTEEVDFDFGARFRENYQRGQERSARVDEQITLFIESFNVSGDETINDIAQGAANS